MGKQQHVYRSCTVLMEFFNCTNKSKQTLSCILTKGAAILDVTRAVIEAGSDGVSTSEMKWNLQASPDWIYVFPGCCVGRQWRRWRGVHQGIHPDSARPLPRGAAPR